MGVGYEGERWDGAQEGGWGLGYQRMGEGRKEGEGGGGERKKEMKTISHSCPAFLVLKVFFCVSDSANGFTKHYPYRPAFGL